jgi:predicted metalloprotease with PDZ domain
MPDNNLVKNVNFKLTVPNPNDQYLNIECTIPTAQREIELQLPSWRPGRYEITNFAKNIRGFKVLNDQNQTIPFHKNSKDSWIVSCKETSAITVKYQYYSNELNAGSTFVSEDMLYVNPVNCFIYTEEHFNNTIELELNIDEKWQTATSLSKKDELFSAESFDELFDTPFICAPTLTKESYSVNGITFYIWFNDLKNIPWEKVITDFKKFTTKQIEDFGEFPSKSFHFLIHTPHFKAYHGVEHLKSTVVALGPSYDVFKGLYSELLGVSSHELYHVWNVKSIRPKVMKPYSFREENYSRLGYIYEGITTYLGDLYLLKSGVFSITDYLKELKVQFQRHFDNPARFYTSVGDSSYDTWLDGYTAGAPGRKLSIYVEGCLLAFVTDYLLRKHTKNKYGIEEVMRRLYFDTKISTHGFEEQDYQKMLENISGISFQDFFDCYLNGNHSYEPILQDALDYFGLEMQIKDNPSIAEHALGIKLQPIQSIIQSIAIGSPAEMCGLRIGDEIIGINKIRLNKDFEKWLSYFNLNDIHLTIVREQKIMEKKMPIVHRNYFQKYNLSVLNEKSSIQSKALQCWACDDSL